MRLTSHESWGRYPSARQEVIPLNWSKDSWPATEKKVLPRGLGRSYGDCCLNDDGVLLETTPLDRLLDFNPSTGILTCESGVTLAEIIRVFSPRGYFPPVVPGTKFVTVGGAIANDVHGKNHHQAGTFGCHVKSLALRRSSGEILACSAESNPELFAATIGGLGLTGVILRAEIILKPIASSVIEVESVRFEDFDSFWDLAVASEQTYEYTVAWMDCLPGRPCRGLFLRGDHADGEPGIPVSAPAAIADSLFEVPDVIPDFLMNSWTMRAFNFAYFHRQTSRLSRKRVGVDPFFFPLDAVGSWNRLYGTRGFLQHQCVIPQDENRSSARRILGYIKGCSDRVFCSLAVVKTFGDRRSPGILSFPRKGITFALDFPADRRETFALLDRIDGIVRDSGGAIYPAKDARMSPETFRASFPRWKEFARQIDPAFSSGFWRRVCGKDEG